MAVVRKKQDDKNLKTLRELVTSGGSGGNRQCFDCGQKGPTYVNMTIGSFVCTRCSGVLRGLTPPHRVKSISMATFTPEEIEFLKSHGNDVCAKTWLGLWDPKRIIHQDQRELMIDKYERKRYYLEPASPLKSLTNNAATKAPPTMNGNTVNGTSNGIHLNGNSNIHLNNNSSKQVAENNLKNIALAPPSTLHLSNNSINSSSSSTNSSRQQNRYNNFQNQFTPDENGFFDSTSSSANKLQNNNNVINGGNTNSNTSHLTNGGLNPLTNHLNNCQISNKNSLNVQNSDNSNFLSNKFTPDSEFVADFGSANIFNAVTSGAAVSANASNKSQANSLNGFKIHQNGTNGHNFSNGETTANAAAPTVNGNSNSSSISNANANFADFDHASIYNAAVYQPSIYENATINNNYTSSTSDLFANNLSYRSDLFSSTNNSSALSNNNNSTVQTTSNFFNDISGFNFTNYPPPLQQQQQHQQQQQQWNIWQQFQSPFSTPSPEQSRWSLPMSLNSTSNSLSSSATFTSNSSINSTPPADRYAALKDLDDQLRESKTSINGSAFNSPAPAAASPNPFTQSTPIAITGTATQQSHQIGNPFQTPSAANVFAASSQPGLFGGASSPPFTATQQSFLGYNNGYGGGGSNATTILPNGGALNNGCGGLAYVPQQMTTGSNAVITNIKNPFATVNSLSNSNNPFL
ncbi:unnamed protein product [Hermetia illucens]|uniref:Arf-GAP domain-containing protein n=1 Tax=Hermetia illucens TaxID=343691 RepID=A0A7R8UFA3_HERIL|nr:arf-GAP domain and FG repeat-containing protein 1 isoform X1 [Hermetia illucens]CAD7079757.1 unnamed protein product [Hermetia illucens]